MLEKRKRTLIFSLPRLLAQPAFSSSFLGQGSWPSKPARKHSASTAARSALSLSLADDWVPPSLSVTLARLARASGHLLLSPMTKPDTTVGVRVCYTT